MTHLTQSNTAHVVMFSGGVGSWMAARRVAERYGMFDADEWGACACFTP